MFISMLFLCITSCINSHFSLWSTGRDAVQRGSAADGGRPQAEPGQDRAVEADARGGPAAGTALQVSDGGKHLIMKRIKGVKYNIASQRETVAVFPQGGSELNYFDSQDSPLLYFN
jgi:hypothetical protein